MSFEERVLEELNRIANSLESPVDPHQLDERSYELLKQQADNHKRDIDLREREYEAHHGSTIHH